MSKQFAIRLGTLAMMVVAFFGMTAHAHAAPQKQQASNDFVIHAPQPGEGAVSVRTVDGQIEFASLSSMGTDDVTVQATHKFNRATTQRIYNVAMAGGAAAVTALCAILAPLPLKPFCGLLGARVVIFFLDNPPRGRCLQVTWKVIPPSVSVRYVTC